MLALAAIINVTSGLGYALPALIGLESMGVPSPGETALVLAAVLASQHQLNIVLVIVIGAASAIVGDNLGYLLGRKLGREVLVSRGPFHAKRERAIAIGDRYFRAHGAKTVFIGRWIALIRFAVAWLAGINHMHFRTFFFWNALGGITWAVAYGLAGYYGGNAVIHVFERVGVVAAIVLGVAIVLGFVYVKVREHRAEQRFEQEEAQDEEPGGDSPGGDPGRDSPTGDPGRDSPAAGPAGPAAEEDATSEDRSPTPPS